MLLLQRLLPCLKVMKRPTVFTPILLKITLSYSSLAKTSDEKAEMFLNELRSNFKKRESDATFAISNAKKQAKHEEKFLKNEKGEKEKHSKPFLFTNFARTEAQFSIAEDKKGSVTQG